MYYYREYFEQLDHYKLLEKIILYVLKEPEIAIGFGNDYENEDFTNISLGEIDLNQTTLSLHCYGEDYFCLHILYDNEDLDKYDFYKKRIDKENLQIIPEGLQNLMLAALKVGEGKTINVNELY